MTIGDSTDANDGERGNDDRLTRLLAYVKADGKVCPLPRKWNELWKMLPGRHRVDGAWEPALPLILAAWWCASAKEKQDRLELHLRYAAKHGALECVERFIRTLEPDEWAYGDGTQRQPRAPVRDRSKRRSILEALFADELLDPAGGQERTLHRQREEPGEAQE